MGLWRWLGTLCQQENDEQWPSQHHGLCPHTGGGPSRKAECASRLGIFFVVTLQRRTSKYNARISAEVVKVKEVQQGKEVQAYQSALPKAATKGVAPAELKRGNSRTSDQKPQQRISAMVGQGVAREK